MSETKFQVGDNVEAWGCRGIVRGVHPQLIEVSFGGTDAYIFFFSDGRFMDWHKEPSLKLIERPKKKVTKTMYQVVFQARETTCLSVELYASEKEARAGNPSSFIALGPAITFEVEE